MATSRSTIEYKKHFIGNFDHHVREYTTGGAIVERELVKISSGAIVSLGSSDTAANVVGYALEGGASGDSILVLTHGTIPQNYPVAAAISDVPAWLNTNYDGLKSKGFYIEPASADTTDTIGE